MGVLAERRFGAASLRRLSEDDAAAFASAMAASQLYHRPWVSYPITPDGVKAYLRSAAEAGDEVFGVWSADHLPHQMGGVIHLSRVTHDPYYSAEVGCAALEGRQGCGLMTEAMKVILQHAFGTRGLHRVWAFVDPDNIASQRMLEKSGFVFEGTAREVVRRDGAWCDLQQWASLADPVTSRSSHDERERG